MANRYGDRKKGKIGDERLERTFLYLGGYTVTAFVAPNSKRLFKHSRWDLSPFSKGYSSREGLGIKMDGEKKKKRKK